MTVVLCPHCQEPLDQHTLIQLPEHWIRLCADGYAESDSDEWDWTHTLSFTQPVIVDEQRRLTDSALDLLARGGNFEWPIQGKKE